jgi:hypothetical protein
MLMPHGKCGVPREKEQAAQASTRATVASALGFVESVFVKVVLLINGVTKLRK